MQSSEFERRYPVRTSLWIAGLWTVVALSVSGRPFARHIEYFERVGPRAPAALVAALILVAAAAVLYSRVRQAGLYRWEPAVAIGGTATVCLLAEPLGALGSAFVLLAAFALGDRLLRALSLTAAPRIVDCALATALGAAVLAFLLFLLGSAGAMNTPAIAGLLLLCCAANPRRLTEPATAVLGLSEAWRDAPEIRSAPLGAAVFYSFQFLLFGLGVALAPAINNDAMRHHLADVRRFLATGGLEVLPSEHFTYFPKSMEVLLAAAEAVGGRPAAEMLNPAFFGLTLLVGYAVVRRSRVSRGGATLGVLIAATVPFFHWTGVIVKNDFLLALFQLGALYAWLRSRDGGRDAWLLVSAFLLGASFGVKHTAAFGAIAIAPLYLWSAWKRPKLLAGMATLALVAGFYWHARTWALSGSPVHPYGVEKATAPIKHFNRHERPPDWLLHLSYPWMIHFDGSSAFESPTDNPAGMFLVFAGVGWLLMRRRKSSPGEIACLAFCGVYYLYWGWIWGLIRYALVPFFLLVALTAARWQSLREEADRESNGLPAAVLTGALVYCFAFATPPTMMIEVNAPQLRYLAGSLDREGYLREAVAGYPVMERLAELWSPNDRVLDIGDYAVVYSPDPSRLHFSGFFQAWNRETVDEHMRLYDYDWVIVPVDLKATAQQEGVLAGKSLAYRDQAFALYGPGARIGRPGAASSTTSPSRNATTPLTSTCRTPAGACAGSE